ncbi:hypothetical protein FFLO_02900 [Filobasidium floriforme]|uniref:Uncharacterized protein n=1 Tax=Filobasidium floriforme TaxID=5210 RepID=A0A8K0JM47_9TREE|nr:hypothetical protein FFLO_02900 [Filobasidium floriforme]
MSNSQQELDLDRWWLQTNLDDIAASGLSDTYVPSLSDWLMEADQDGNMMLSQEAGYQYGEQVDRVSMGLQHSSSRWDQTSIGCGNTTPVRSIASEDKQDWSHCDGKLEQFMRTFEQDIGLQQYEGLRSLHEPPVGETSVSEYVGSGYLNDQDLHPNDQDSTLQTFDAVDQVSQKCLTITTIDRQRGPWEVRTKDNLDTVEPKQKRAVWLAGRGRPPKRCILRQKNGAAFPDTNGKFVSALAMPGIRDVAAFIGCHGSTIRQAMARTNEDKGIVLGIWRVDEYNENEAVKDEDLLIQLEEQSYLGQQTHQDSVVSAGNHCCIDGSETTLSDVHTGLNAAGGHEQNISLASPSLRQSSYLSVDPVQHLTAAGGQASGAAIVGSGYMIEYPKGSLKPGAPAKLYLVRRADGQHFDHEEKSVPFALICTDRDEYIRKNSLILPMQRSNSGSANQHETYKRSHQAGSTVLLSSEDSLVSTNPINPAIGHQASDLEGTIGSREQAVFHTKKGQATFRSVATRKKMQKNAINHHQSISDAAKTRMLEIHEKLLHVERVDGTSFPYNKQQVYFAIIQGRLAASKFLECNLTTIRYALQKRGKKKGILKKVWRVKDLGKAIPSA